MKYGRNTRYFGENQVKSNNVAKYHQNVKSFNIAQNMELEFRRTT